jgi:hypothetical protein
MNYPPLGGEPTLPECAKADGNIDFEWPPGERRCLR